MCPDSDRYFNFISIYRWQSMQYKGSPQCEWWRSDVQSKKMPVWLRVCWQKEHVCCVLSYRTWKITNSGICNTDMVLFCLLISLKIQTLWLHNLFHYCLFFIVDLSFFFNSRPYTEPVLQAWQGKFQKHDKRYY